MSDEEFYRFCQLHPDLRIERTIEGDLVIMPPTGGETGRRNFTISGLFFNWVVADGTGVGFDSSTEFALPNGAHRSPDVACIRRGMVSARAPGTGCKECRYHHVCDPEAHYRPRERRRASSMASSLNSSKLSWTERSVPRFVERELRSFLDCGVPAHGFLRVHCDACGRERPVAFSCKGRTLCASCDGRRMADTVVHLVDHVLPKVSVR